MDDDLLGRRGALAAALMAAFELAKAGDASLEQQVAFGPIWLAAAKQSEPQVVAA